MLSTTLTLDQNLMNLSKETADIKTEKSNIAEKSPINIPLLENSQAFEAEISLKERAEKIDAYFNKRGLPLAGQGRKMVEIADKYGLDWRIMPAIAMRESTGGKFACKSVSNSPFGFGSCKINFKTLDESIETVAKNLSGKNPRTADYYDGELKEDLENYNGRAVPHYAEEVIAIMGKISPEA